MFYILVERKTERLNYVLHHIFEVMLGVQYRVFSSTEEFLSQKPTGVFAETDGKTAGIPVLNYTSTWMPGALFMPPSNLLSEVGVHPFELPCKEENGECLCFPIDNPKSDFRMDLFAACFYFLSRYEEYLPFTPDTHGRYPAALSWACRHGYLHKALVDKWVCDFGKQLKSHFPSLLFKERKAWFTPTYDIDIAYAFKQKSLALQIGSMVKSLFKADFKTARSRLKVWCNREKDPYDTFDWLENLREQYQLNPFYFVLFASRAVCDKGISPENPAFCKLIRDLAQHNSVGIHLSYQSAFQSEAVMRNEIGNLSNLLGNNINSNRFHYLRFCLPESYRNLIHCDIKHDYSMGYATHVGFRAGTCTPFAFYDLLDEKVTPLQIHPLLFMENSLESASTKTFDSCWCVVQPLLDEVIAYGGEVVTLFHNQSFGNMPGHSLPTKDLYIKINTYLQQNGINSLG